MRRCAVFAALLVALAGAGDGVAAPSLVVRGSSGALGARGDTTIELTAPEGTTGLLTFFAPPGYSARLDLAPGAPVGQVVSAVAAIDAGDIELTGTLTATDPSAPIESGCAPAAHAAVWLLELAGPGTTVSVLVFVDPVIGAPESAYASYRLEACLGDLRLRALRLRLTDIFENPGSTGEYTWRARLGAGSPEGDVEIRAAVLLPVRLSLAGRYRAASHAAALEGSLIAGGRPVADATVVVTGGAGAEQSARTDGRGRFNLERAISGATTFRASVSVTARDVTASGCLDPIAPGGCVSAVIAPFSARSDAVRIAPPPTPVLRLGSRGASVRRLQEGLRGLRYLPPGSASGVFDERTWHAVVAFQGWQRLPRDGVVAARTWAALERGRIPVAPAGLPRGLVVDTSRQVLLLVASGRVQRAIHVSTAAPGHWTPHGRFRVYRKETLSWSVPFRAWMPYANYFVGGFAIHGFASVPPYPASHGCIRVPMAEATVVYSFAVYGTPVLVR